MKRVREDYDALPTPSLDWTTNAMSQALWPRVMDLLFFETQIVLIMVSSWFRELFLEKHANVKEITFDKKVIPSLRKAFILRIKSVRANCLCALVKLLEIGAPIHNVTINGTFTSIPRGITHVTFTRKLGGTAPLIITSPDITHLSFLNHVIRPIEILSPIEEFGIWGTYDGPNPLVHSVKLHTLSIGPTIPMAWVPETVRTLILMGDVTNTFVAPPFIRKMVFKGRVAAQIELSNVTHTVFKNFAMDDFISLSIPSLKHVEFANDAYVSRTVPPPNITHLTIGYLRNYLWVPRLCVPHGVTHLTLLQADSKHKQHITGLSITHLDLGTRVHSHFCITAPNLVHVRAPRKWVRRFMSKTTWTHGTPEIEVYE